MILPGDAAPQDDPEYPFAIYLGRWGEDDVMFYAVTLDDAEPVWLTRDQVAWFAEVVNPGEQEFVRVPRLEG